MSRHLYFLILLSFAFVMFRSTMCDAQPPAMHPGPKSPAESLKCMKPRPGFKVELMAAEPLVMDPIAFAWGPDGKFWVVEMGDYPLGVDGKGKHGGRIKFLEKTKLSGGRKPPERNPQNPQGADAPRSDDGPYDKATVFLDNLGYPTGVLPWGKGVLVTCAPDIFYAEDTDGDGKADKKVVLFTGFNEGNQQHRVNSLVWGIDNWIHVANGDSGGVIKSLKTGKTLDIRGRDLRIRPDTGEMDATTGQTQFGRARDDWGNWFGNNNTQPMFHYVLDDYYLRRNPHMVPPNTRVQVSIAPGSAPVYPISKPLPRFNSPNALNHFTSACSAIVYRDNLFGPAFENNTFVSEPVHNLIHREIMTPKGVTFTSRRADDEQKSEFLASTDNWFRPAMIQTGPDGALWVADMYRYVIEHPQWIPVEWQKKLDLRAGHDMGRIYRIYPSDKKPRPIPRLEKLDTAGLVAALDSPSGWQRDMAQMMLVRSKDMTARDHLIRIWDHHNPLTRLSALCTLEAMGLCIAGARDDHPMVRAHSIRNFETTLRKEGELAVGDIIGVANPLQQPDIRVRLQIAYSLGEWSAHEHAGKALGQLALKDGADPYMRAAIFSSVNKHNFSAFAKSVLEGGKQTPIPPAVLNDLFRLALAYENTKVVGTLLAEISTPVKGQHSTWQITALASFLDALDQRNSSLGMYWLQADRELKPQLKDLSPLFDAARSFTKQADAPKGAKLAALRLLGRGFDQREADMKLLAGLLVPQTADDVQSAAIAALGQLRDKQVPELVLRGWKRYAPPLRAQTLDVLLGRPEWLTATLDAIEKKKIAPFEIDAARRQRLLDHKLAKVRERAVKLLAGSVDADREKVVERYKPALAMKGDASRGVAVFKRTCAACHQLGGVGQQVGPDLAPFSVKPSEELLIAILDPNRAVDARYVNYTATTKNGVNHSGMLASETATSITLVGVDGKSQTVLRSELEDLHSSGKSVMPEGLEKDIKLEEMADLLAFLRNPPAPKNEPQRLRDTEKREWRNENGRGAAIDSQ